MLSGPLTDDRLLHRHPPRLRLPDGVARFGRNLDFPSFDLADTQTVVQIYRPDDGRNAFMAVGWPGMAGVLSGMNEHGLTLANMEVRRPSRLPSAMPYILLYRTVLERCTTVEEAIALLQKTPARAPNNLMLMDATGDRVVELTPDKVHVRRTESAADPLISTNHHRGDDCATSGRCRLRLLVRATREQPGRIDVAALQSMLADASQDDMTLQSMVFEPSTRVIHLSAGKDAARRKFQPRTSSPISPNPPPRANPDQTRPKPDNPRHATALNTGSYGTRPVGLPPHDPISAVVPALLNKSRRPVRTVPEPMGNGWAR